MAEIWVEREEIFSLRAFEGAKEREGREEMKDGERRRKGGKERASCLSI